MINLNELPIHIRSLSRKAWNKLFDLIPKIEHAKSFGEVIIGQEL